MHNLIFLTDLTGSDLDPYMRLNEAQLFMLLNLIQVYLLRKVPK